MTDQTNDDHDFVGKSVIFVGDSHMRGLANLFLKIVCQYQLNQNEVLDPLIMSTVQSFHMDPHTESSKTCSSSSYTATEVANDPSCHIEFDQGCNGMTVSFFGAQYCEPDIPIHVADYDYIILNCGHHPASHSHYSFHQYSEAVNKLFFILNAHAKHIDDPKKRGKIFWLENSAQPLREDHWVIEKLDWRTYHRLILFDAQAKEIFANKYLDLNVGLIPAFHSTMALYDKICDCAHFPNSARIPQLVGLIDAIRFYNSDGKREDRKRIV
jgi:hypothetical protein